MNKLIILLTLIILIGGCSKQKPISSGSLVSLICGSEIKNNLKKYIFDKNNGNLYFYNKNEDKFIPLSLRFESGFYSESDSEFYSNLYGNKLKIIYINYSKEIPQKIFKEEAIINLYNLKKKIIYKNHSGLVKSYIVKCRWTNPKH
tara:strand:+ start:29140 stop:29577 length:438 start_codon:yes stop_codon:yes gene_type:complete